MSHLQLVSDTEPGSLLSHESSASSAASSRDRPAQLRLVQNTGSRYRPPVRRAPPRLGSIMPRWVTLAVGASAALASLLVAVIGFEAGAPRLPFELDPLSGGQPAWVQLQPLVDEGAAEAAPLFRRSATPPHLPYRQR